jgi:hypothetical protein
LSRASEALMISSVISRTTTSKPAFAKVCAMSKPMVPPPMTTTFFIFLISFYITLIETAWGNDSNPYRWIKSEKLTPQPLFGFNRLFEKPLRVFTGQTDDGKVRLPLQSLPDSLCM